ncbi:MAG: DUF5107 domain-containing protein [Acidobacteriota bacterium]|nr:MAG: DUF5107 domain-containing protein [Acidobacteriota bacterium]
MNFRTITIIFVLFTMGLSVFAAVQPDKGSRSQFLIEETFLILPQVDYEGAIYYQEDAPLPHLDFKKVQWKKVIEKRHRAVILSNQYLQVTVLPEMGRVYSMVFKPTGNETLWHNDVAVPGGANNETGWWLWLGGIEYTLPRDEHGTTWALTWEYRILEDNPIRKSLLVEVTEPGTGLHETIIFRLYPDASFLETEILIENPGSEPVDFAHWVNPMWVPGGKNELTDGTEFIVPTKQILIEKRWQANLGPSPQPWIDNPLRVIRNWKMGDIMADGLDAGFFGAFAHEENEGVVRIFDPVKNPGVDIWTYGFRPSNIPMGSGAPSKGYVEIWGGTVKHFPNELGQLEGGAQMGWTEWIYPFHQTKGLTYANENAAIHFSRNGEDGGLTLFICPARSLQEVTVELEVRGLDLLHDTVNISPANPYRKELRRSGDDPLEERSLVLTSAGVVLLRYQTSE